MIAMDVAIIALDSVRAIARLNEPETSRCTRSSRIRWGDCMVSVSMVPTAHGNSSTPAKASRISTRTSVSRHLVCISSLDGLVPQQTPQTCGDAAEAFVFQDSAVGSLNDVEDA